MGITDIVILASVAATLFFSIRSLVRANKNGCSDCGAACSGHAAGRCSKVARMIPQPNDRLMATPVAELLAARRPAAPAALRWETRAKHACGNVTLFTYVFSADPREESA